MSKNSLSKEEAEEEGALQIEEEEGGEEGEDSSPEEARPLEDGEEEGEGASEYLDEEEGEGAPPPEETKKRKSSRASGSKRGSARTSMRGSLEGPPPPADDEEEEMDEEEEEDDEEEEEEEGEEKAPPKQPCGRVPDVLYSHYCPPFVPLEKKRKSKKRKGPAGPKPPPGLSKAYWSLHLSKFGKPPEPRRTQKFACHEKEKPEVVQGPQLPPAPKGFYWGIPSSTNSSICSDDQSYLQDYADHICGGKTLKEGQKKAHVKRWGEIYEDSLQQMHREWDQSVLTSWENRIIPPADRVTVGCTRLKGMLKLGGGVVSTGIRRFVTTGPSNKDLIWLKRTEVVDEWDRIVTTPAHFNCNNPTETDPPEAEVKAKVTKVKPRIPSLKKKKTGKKAVPSPRILKKLPEDQGPPFCPLPPPPELRMPWHRDPRVKKGAVSPPTTPTDIKRTLELDEIIPRSIDPYGDERKKQRYLRDVQLREALLSKFLRRMEATVKEDRVPAACFPLTPQCEKDIKLARLLDTEGFLDDRNPFYDLEHSSTGDDCEEEDVSRLESWQEFESSAQSLEHKGSLESWGEYEGEGYDEYEGEDSMEDKYKDFYKALSRFYRRRSTNIYMRDFFDPYKIGDEEEEGEGEGEEEEEEEPPPLWEDFWGNYYGGQYYDGDYQSYYDDPNFVPYSQSQQALLNEEQAYWFAQQQQQYYNYEEAGNQDPLLGQEEYDENLEGPIPPPQGTEGQFVNTQGRRSQGQGQPLPPQQGQGQRLSLPPGQGQPLPPQQGQGQRLSQSQGQGQRLSLPPGQGQPLPPQGQGQRLSLPPGQGQPLPPQQGQGQRLSQSQGQGQRLSLPPGQGQPLPPPQGQGQRLSQSQGQGQRLSQSQGQGQRLSQSQGQGQRLSQSQGQGQRRSLRQQGPPPTPASM